MANVGSNPPGKKYHSKNTLTDLYSILSVLCLMHVCFQYLDRFRSKMWTCCNTYMYIPCTI